MLDSVPPMLSIANQLEGAYVGQDVALECDTEAFPSSINYWTTERGDMIVSGEKYETVSVDHGYSKFMMLKIKNVTTKDFGTYQCVAKNSLGETDGVIKLEEIPGAVSRTSTTSISAVGNNTIPHDKGRGKMKQERYSKQETEEYQWQDSDYVEEDYVLPTPLLPDSNSRGWTSPTPCFWALAFLPTFHFHLLLAMS